jgi:deoxyribodipyrimidine photo-lyase
MTVPAVRIRDSNQAPLKPAGKYVLYWMIANRRLGFNFALDRALEHCRDLRKPLLIFESLRCDYPWASDRFHQFVFDGITQNATACQRYGVTYYAYVEPAKGADKGLLAALAKDACVVVTDDFPCFFLPRMVTAAAKQLLVRLEAVDSNGLLPLRATNHVFPTAYAFRRFLQKTLPEHLEASPTADPLTKIDSPSPAPLAASSTGRWPQASTELLEGGAGILRTLPIDHAVRPTGLGGGHSSAHEQLQNFVTKKLASYGEHRNDPELDATSGLSPYLHFGHISIHEVFAEIARAENWRPEKLALRATGSKEGWWNMTQSAEGFLDEIVTWREVGFNFCAHRTDYDQYESLPPWAQRTLKEHAKDKRRPLYSPEQLEAAKTHDPLWNAAQIQLMQEGRIHNYLRMLWGKKILEWSRTPQEALKTLIHLNNKYSLDGRNPNSYSGIFWCLGRYDRPWGPERPIFGKIRYMSSENTARKVSVGNYIRKYGPADQKQLDF